MATDFTRISIPRMSHYISGTGKTGRGVLFRPLFTPEEHEAQYSYPHKEGTFKSGLDARQEYRIECSPSEPGDVYLDLGTPELNDELVALLNKALAVRGGLA